MKKLILLVGVVLIAIVAAFLIGKYGDRLSTKIVEEQEENNSYSEKDWLQKETPQERSQGAVASIVESTKNKKEIVGIVTSLSKPTAYDVVYLEVTANIINLDALNDVDFKNQSTELPMVQQVFDITVDNTTKLKNIGGKDEIMPGSMVRAVSGLSIYEKQNFTAMELEVLATR